MKRRSLFQLALGAVAASAMEVFSWTLPNPEVEYDEEWIWRNAFSEMSSLEVGKYYATLMLAYGPQKFSVPFNLTIPPK